MKQLYWVLFFGLGCLVSSLAQQPTEVFLVELKQHKDTLKIGATLNISNNEGYDNQPAFYDDETILFAKTRNGQTDIALYNVKDTTTVWLSNTPKGSEYSPLKVPDSEAVSAIRLDKDGLQRLYKYDLKTKKPTLLLANLKVGYHVWYSPNIIVSTVLKENRMDLVVSNLKENTNYTLQENVGRSLHKIPNTELISFISKANDSTTVRSIHPITRNTKDIISLMGNIEDVCWTNNGSLIAAYDKTIISYNPLRDEKWQLVHTFKERDIHGISRLAIGPKENHLALVSKDASDIIVQKQVKAFNARNLKGFVDCYSKDVVVTNFPSDTLYIGKQIMYEKYKEFYDRTPDINVKVNSRIVRGATVIDEEIVTIEEKQQKQVAIYKTDGLIKSMCFIKDKKTDINPELVVNKQLDAYNSRDIDAFLETYSDAVKLYNFPDSIRTEGLENMREDYVNFFNTTADLHCKIINRIIIGDKVIDEELITANGKTFEAVAIYEVQNGKITKVTFVR